MKKLNNYKLLIDADCPMCRLYGNGFEKIGIVEKGTCYPYQYADISIDMVKAKNEIALINIQSNEVVYGIDAFRVILTNSFEWVDKVFKNNFINWVLPRIYRFISFNRKVIAPSSIKSNERVCIPSQNLFYRWLYIIAVVLFSSLVLFEFSKPINQILGFQSSYKRELAICFGQILWQSLFLKKLLQSKYLDYIGNMLTVSLIGTLLLLPVFIFSLLPFIHIFYFTVVVGFMLIEHLRRCKILEIGILPSLSWIIYRVVVLFIIYLTK